MGTGFKRLERRRWAIPIGRMTVGASHKFRFIHDARVYHEECCVVSTINTNKTSSLRGQFENRAHDSLTTPIRDLLSVCLIEKLYPSGARVGSESRAGCGPRRPLSHWLIRMGTAPRVNKPIATPPTLINDCSIFEFESFRARYYTQLSIASDISLSVLSSTYSETTTVC